MASGARSKLFEGPDVTIFVSYGTKFMVNSVSVCIFTCMFEMVHTAAINNF